MPVWKPIQSTALNSGVVQKVAFLRANLDDGNDADQVIFVTANRVVAKMTELAPVDFVVYRYQSEPIIDGELIFRASSYRGNRLEKLRERVGCLRESIQGLRSDRRKTALAVHNLSCAPAP